MIVRTPGGVNRIVLADIDAMKRDPVAKEARREDISQGTEMRRLRNKCRLSQRQLAAMITGASPGAIHFAETTTTRPGLRDTAMSTLRAYAAANGISLDT